MTVPDEAVEAAVGHYCVSNIHETPEPATSRGTFTNPWLPDGNHVGVWYCDTCAATGESLRMFTPDKETL